jgi:hypothetical protein
MRRCICNNPSSHDEQLSPQIPVRPTAFQYDLPNLADRLKGVGPVKIVALGSSTTAGEGGIVAYPYRLVARLRERYSNFMIDVLNRGVGGEEAPVERDRMERDVIAEEPSLVMDLQFLPALLTPATIEATNAMVFAISEVGREMQVNLFRRFELMQGWHESEGISFDTMVDPIDDKRLHDSDWTTQRLARTLGDVIVDTVNKTWATRPS